MKLKKTECGKVGFDEIGAKIALAKIQHNDDTRRFKMEKRVYRCPTCGMWHLTSRE